MLAAMAHPLLLLYGSQTGTAQEVAEQIAEMARRRNFEPRLSSMDAYPRAQLDDEALVLFVCSTTGEGTCPDNMARFWRFLLRKDLPPSVLGRMHFGIFGLGDSSYSKFNAVARRLGARLLQLGATEICSRGLGDDQSTYGFLSDLDPWLAQLWPRVLARYPLPPAHTVDDAPRLEPLPFAVRWLGAKSAEGSQRGAEESTGAAAAAATTGTAGAADATPTAAAVGASGFVAHPWYRAPAGAHNATVYPARVLANTRMTAADWEQDVRHLDLDISQPDSSGQQLNYRAGDVALLYPENTGNGIDGFLRAQGMDPAAAIAIEHADATAAVGAGVAPPMPPPGGGGAAAGSQPLPLDLPSPLTVGQLFARHLDVLGTPRRRFFGQLSLFTPDEEEREKLLEIASTEGSDLLHDYCKREKRTYVEVFADFPKVRVPLDRLIALIPPLQPRAFSIASSALAHPGRLQLCVGIVRFTTPWKRTRTGVCSSWIAALQPGAVVPLWVRPGLLHMPPEPDTLTKPMLMIGPGTGIAPMRAMMEERAVLRARARAAQAQGAAPEDASLLRDRNTLLYCGCRQESKDFLYGEQFRSSVESDDLLTLRTAFSRDQVHKIYVTTRLMENAAEVWGVIAQGGYVYISGSANRMPADVREIMETIAQEQGGMSAQDATKLFNQLERRGRYNVEAWS